MATINASQQADWANNVYLLTTARMLMVLGLAYLARSIYQLSRILAHDSSHDLCRDNESQGRQEDIEHQRLGSSHGSGNDAVAGADETTGVELEALILEVPMLSAEAVAGVNKTTFELSVPQPAHSPQDRSSRHPFSPHQQIRNLKPSATASEIP